MALQLRPQGGKKGAILLVDGALTAKEMVMLRHRLHPRARDVLSPQDVFQERHHIIGFLRPAKRDQQNCAA